MQHEHEHEGSNGHDHPSHHVHMVADFRRRFWIALALTVPVLVLAPLIQGFPGLTEALAFPADSYGVGICFDPLYARNVRIRLDNPSGERHYGAPVTAAVDGARRPEDTA